MKFIVFALILVITLGLRHAHKSQYDLGYEAGLQDAMDASEVRDSQIEFCSSSIEGEFFKSLLMRRALFYWNSTLEDSRSS